MDAELLQIISDPNNWSMAGFWIPMAVAAISAILSSQLNKKSGSQQSAERSLGRASGAQAEELQRQTELRKWLESVLRGDAQMPRSDSPPIFQFPDAAGGPALDPAMLAGISPAISPEMAALMDLAGLPAGTSAVTSAGAIGANQSNRREDQVSSFITDMVQSLLAGGLLKGGSSTGASAPWPSPTPFPTIPEYDIEPDPDFFSPGNILTPGG